MVIFNYLVYELLSDVAYWVQVQGDHASHLIFIDFYEVNTCVRAYNDLVPQTCRLHLVNVTDRIEALADVHTQRTDRNYVNEAVVLATHDLVFVDLS